MADSKEYKFVEPTVEDMVTKLSFGVGVSLGQKCGECPQPHFCDAVCFRFSPKTYLCQGCGQYQRHRKIEELIRTYHMNKLLEDGA